MTTYSINPPKPIKFNEKAIQNVLDEVGFIYADIKHDSVRCLMVIKPTADIDGNPAARCYAFSRSDKLLPSLCDLFSSHDDQIMLGQLLSESLYPNGIIIDGEMMVKGVDFQTGSGMLRRKAAIDIKQLEYVMYGYVALEHFAGGDKKTSFPISTCVMKEQLNVLYHQVLEMLPSLDWSVCRTQEVYSMEQLDEVYNDARAMGHEGLVLKSPFAQWYRGKKVGMWKMKPEDTVDGTVCGILWGTPGKSNEGKVIGFEVLLESGMVVSVDGLTEQQKTEYTASVGGDPEFYNGWYIQVKFMEYTPDGSLRHPKFDCWRGTESDPKVKS